jgi:hypothetical protein
MHYSLKICIQIFWFCARQLVISRIFSKSPEEICPCQVVNAVLLGKQCARSNFCIEMVYYLIFQGGFDGERFIEEFLVKVLFLFADHNTGHTSLIEAWTTSSTNHLEQVSQWEIDIASHLGIKELSTLNHD